DFFLSGVMAYEEMWGNIPGAWTNALYYSHGYAPLKKRILEDGMEQVKNDYPCNLEVLQNAKGIILHSEYAKQLGSQYYTKEFIKNWKVIPQLHEQVVAIDRDAARKKLGIESNSFVVCSFGLLGLTKCNLQLLLAWLDSELAADEFCELIFVGENQSGEYRAQLNALIKQAKYKANIKVTGWISAEQYQHYLSAADIAVQLRSTSRGETSRAVLDCMAYGLPTIINANGAMAEFDSSAVYQLTDQFSQNELIEALELLRSQPEKRQQLSAAAKRMVETKHSPAQCAELYAKAVNEIYKNCYADRYTLLSSLANMPGFPTQAESVKQIVQAIAALSARPMRQLLVDVSVVVQNDLKTGIERVVRALLLELVLMSPLGFRVEPVYLSDSGGAWHYRYARKYTSELLGLEAAITEDMPIDISHGDIFYALDFCPNHLINAAQAGLFARWKALGVEMNVMVYDLLPVLRPDCFPEGASENHANWLKAITKFADQLIGISAAVVNELDQWLRQNPPVRTEPLKLASVQLGADLEASAPTTGKPMQAAQFLETLKRNKSFLMVGTIEPRKGYLQTLEAFEKLWEEGREVYLVIVGKEGWRHLPDKQRRTIPTIIKKLEKNPERNKRLFWLQDVSDEYLEEIYQACTCLIAASEGEGFGLPLIEAAKYNLPIIARDLPVFKEIIQGHAYYFSGLEADNLSQAIKDWLSLFESQQAPSSHEIRWNTWFAAGQQLMNILLGSPDTGSLLFSQFVKDGLLDKVV
ncbi:MAG TPA: glycosyltransferase, partial [Gammaproteobacteria bacterium]|nr:glycosyltransferase [Gammaproteobacteria bacterium]